MHNNFFDGCMYELHSSKRGREHMYLKTPCNFSSNAPEVSQFFIYTCTGQYETHMHEPCTGKDALHSQFYRPFIATLVHVSFMMYFRRLHRTNTSVRAITDQYNNAGSGQMPRRSFLCRPVAAVCRPTCVVPRTTRGDLVQRDLPRRPWTVMCATPNGR